LVTNLVTNAGALKPSLSGQPGTHDRRESLGFPGREPRTSLSGPPQLGRATPWPVRDFRGKPGTSLSGGRCPPGLDPGGLADFRGETPDFLGRPRISLRAEPGSVRISGVVVGGRPSCCLRLTQGVSSRHAARQQGLAAVRDRSRSPRSARLAKLAAGSHLPAALGVGELEGDFHAVELAQRGLPEGGQAVGFLKGLPPPDPQERRSSLGGSHRTLPQEARLPRRRESFPPVA